MDHFEGDPPQEISSGLPCPQCAQDKGQHRHIFSTSPRKLGRRLALFKRGNFSYSFYLCIYLRLLKFSCFFLPQPRLPQGRHQLSRQTISVSKEWHAVPATALAGIAERARWDCAAAPQPSSLPHAGHGFIFRWANSDGCLETRTVT